MLMVPANTFVQMYALEHSDFVVHRWHVFVTYLVSQGRPFDHNDQLTSYSDCDLDWLPVRLLLQSGNALPEYLGDSPDLSGLIGHGHCRVRPRVILAVMKGLTIPRAVMPGSGGRPPHASSSFVWAKWTADIGYPNG